MLAGTKGKYDEELAAKTASERSPEKSLLLAG